LLTGGKYGNIKIEMEMEMEMEISHFAVRGGFCR